MRKITLVGIAVALCAALPLKAQTILGGKVTGNVQIDAQVSREDTAIGAANVPEKFLSNVFGNILYTTGNFRACVVRNFLCKKFKGIFIKC